MNNHPDDNRRESDVLQRRIVDTLEHQARRLEPATEQALDRARRLALDTPAPRRWWQGGMFALTSAAGAVAAAAFVVAISLQLIGAPVEDGSGLPPAMPMSEDLELVMGTEFDLLVEDPEFVAWLTEIPASDIAPVPDEEQSG